MASSQSASAAADGRIRRRYGSIVSRRPLPIRHDLGNPPPPLWRRFIHWWRYGSYHPDEDLLGVIDAAIDSLTTQIKAAETMAPYEDIAWLEPIADLGDQPQLRTICVAAIAAGIAARDAPCDEKERPAMST